MKNEREYHDRLHRTALKRGAVLFLLTSLALGALLWTLREQWPAAVIMVGFWMGAAAVVPRLCVHGADGRGEMGCLPLQTLATIEVCAKLHGVVITLALVLFLAWGAFHR